MRMQLNRCGSIRSALTAVTAALVGGATPADSAGIGQSETSLLTYSEHDRVHAKEAMFSVTKLLRNNYTLNWRLTYDGLTGASPTGGSPSKQAQTVTRPSGGGRVIVPAGELPIDNSFRETRFALDAGLSRPLNDRTTARGGFHISSEHDYRSLGLSGGLSRDFDNARTTMGIDFSISRDLNSPLGGVPTPFDSTTAPAETQNGRRITNGNRQKKVYTSVFTLTRILTPTAISRITYAVDYASGYLTDPYKIISVVQPSDSADPGEPVHDLYERRPNSRLGNAVSVDLRKYVFGMTSEMDYRYFWDDWGVRSHTVYFSLKRDMKRRGALQPNVRLYRQSRSNFSRPFLIQGLELPTYASSDYRLAAFDALTYGLTYSVPTSPSSRLTLSAERYVQQGDNSPPESFGPLLAFKLFPNLKVLMLRVGLTHEF
jgi:Protein of unknown function (DUF3570)